jgi:hypothetical protein
MVRCREVVTDMSVDEQSLRYEIVAATCHAARGGAPLAEEA